jgi:pSer/pThr/pTyr-binding forkhead associated (FHA) protein
MDSDKKPPTASDEITKPPRKNLLDEPARPALNSEEITIPPGEWTEGRATLPPESGKLTVEVRRAGGVRQAPVSISGGRLLVGRTEGEIRINDRMVSHQHAAIDWQKGKAPVLTDLGSTNGTFLNGQRLTGPEELKDKDEIRVGASFLSVRLAGDAS